MRIEGPAPGAAGVAASADSNEPGELKFPRTFESCSHIYLAAEKTEFDLKLVSFDSSAKIKLIKEVRGLTGLGLQEVFLILDA